MKILVKVCFQGQKQFNMSDQLGHKYGKGQIIDIDPEQKIAKLKNKRKVK